ncbi:replication factor C subunit 4-like isoform X2 [Hydractinia symbiolongicarpus]|nr:replication factor C subunit 4-like isoform X2 [Hydractinia symbiolongicarpus]XP_057301801.1 replication factor C subunit 4-like isoform X2 [Hydractinia symbiolongicarpus]
MMMDQFFKSKKAKLTSQEQRISKPIKNLPWVEKYRPRTVQDVAHQDEVVAVLQNTVKGSDFPNLLFYGPPGTGKTSTILAVCRQLFGHDLYRSRVLELNASDERGIQVVRDKVKNFATQAVSGQKQDGTPCPPFKIVILDEADSMTTHAQAALRRTMEKQTKTTRFCLICNYVSRIIEPITSRLAKFRFKPLAIETIRGRLQMITKAEAVDIEEKAVEEVIKASEGDMRKAITYLQSAHRLKLAETITTSDIIEMAGVIPEDVLKSLIETCYSGSFDKLDDEVKGMINEGYSASQAVNQLHDKLVILESISDNQKSVILEKFAVVDKCLCDGADEYLQIMAVCTVIMDQLCKSG